MSKEIDFASRHEAEHEAMRNALICASAAFEMLRPKNHGQTSDAELAGLISMADHVVHEVLEVVGSGRNRADANYKSPHNKGERAASSRTEAVTLWNRRASAPAPASGRVDAVAWRWRSKQRPNDEWSATTRKPFPADFVSCEVEPLYREPSGHPPRWQKLRDLLGLDGWHDGHFHGVPDPDQIIAHVEHVANERARLLLASLSPAATPVSEAGGDVLAGWCQPNGITKQAEYDIDRAIGGTYELPDGRSFWLDHVTVKEIMRRAVPFIAAECERHRLIGGRTAKPVKQGGC